MSKGVPNAPKGLSSSGRALWRRIHQDLPLGWALDERERAILTMACRQQSDLSRLEEAVRKEGTIVPGSKQQPTLHPAIAEARAARQAISRLIRQLDIPGVQVSSGEEEHDDGTTQLPFRKGDEAAGGRL